MIIVLVGLPGSGKTYLGKQLSKDLNQIYEVEISCAVTYTGRCLASSSFY
jgi:tRNA uridine 5-carbamoylmethylation protein Kti12